MKLNRFLAVVLALLAAVGAYAQSQTTGALTGTVTLGGSPLPGATVTISSPQLQGTRTEVTDTNGAYRFANIAPGDYTVRFEMESMQAVTRTVKVSLTSTSRADAEMRLSQVAESITVTASAPAVVETTEIQTNITQNLVEALPVNRTLLGAVNLAPGVTNNGPGGNTAISGGFAYDSTYYVDGAVVNEVLRGQPQNLFIEDAVQETTIQTGAISAEYGRFTGGVVTAVSKSGGNEFSGSLRDSINNAAWTAQGELKEARPDSKLVHTYEGTLGGYILRDRLWFFTAGRYFDFATQRFLGVTVGSKEAPIPYGATETETRMEFKLTGQITPRHTLVGSYFDIDRDQTNNNQGTPLELSYLDPERSLPNSFKTINYNGVITNNLLIEGLYAKQDFSFVNAGGVAGPPEVATNIRFQNNSDFRGGGTAFCGNCSGPEERNNANGKAKANYFLSTKGLGSHNIAGGYEYYEDMLKSDNHQSGSDYTVFTYAQDLYGVSGLTANDPKRGPNGELLASAVPGSALIIWFPIVQAAQGNSFKTQSLFLNDKWDMNEHFSFNLGVRYDQNKGKDNAGAKVADDSNISPRIGAIYDFFGNGRLRANASYSVYASKIANGNVGDAASPAGQPSYLYWVYGGDPLTDVTTPVLLKGLFDWFNSVGGTNNKDWLAGGGTAGIQTQIKGQLQSPSVREYNVGLGSQIGSNGFVRVDYQDREWSNFYAAEASTEIGTVFDPLAGADVDLNLITNSDDFTRRYKAFLVQGSYRLFNRLNLGGNYTYSTLRGNIEGESAGAGPGTSGGNNYFPEYTNYERNRPIGYLAADQRHKVRAYATYDLPTPIGSFNFSVLQRYDSGTPYSLTATINPRTFQKADGTIGTRPNPGYAFAPTTATYYISDRGAFRTDNISATDFGLNYNLPISRANLFFQGEVLNAFNRQGATSVNTSVTVVRQWDPFTMTPQECPAGTTSAKCLSMFPTGGIYRKGTSWGTPTTPTTGSSLLPGGTAGSLQLPRTYRFSFGVKF
ncbi:MAG TPA: carboxypeptidase regulatory-like domain-containing protein [Thermoanaerobaculia bacterium]|nr:carboxypeptidase regulatory-like domain-containing protein [Thermoanaerobaculia bacterium]